MVDLPAYEVIGRGYSRHRAADPRIVGRLARMLGPPENGAVVEVGAGTGNYAAALAKRGYRVVRRRLQVLEHWTGVLVATHGPGLAEVDHPQGG